MKKSKKKKAGRIQSIKTFASSRPAVPVVGEMLLSLLTMPLVYYFISNMIDETGKKAKIGFFFLACVYVCLGLRRLLQAMRYKKRNSSKYLKLIIYGIIFLAASLIMCALGDSPAARIISGVYVLSLVADRIISCIHKRTISNIVLNLLVGFILLSIYFETATSEILYYMEAIFILLGAILSTLSFVFGRIKVGMLMDIVHQTFAAEIIGGLLLLIFVFSFILMLFETNITTYGDALWYCFAIVTTIGFGDIAASSVIGRILSVILGIYGIVVVALITSIIVAFYGEMKKEAIQVNKEEDDDEDDDDWGAE